MWSGGRRGPGRDGPGRYQPIHSRYASVRRSPSRPVCPVRLSRSVHAVPPVRVGRGPVRRSFDRTKMASSSSLLSILLLLLFLLAFGVAAVDLRHVSDDANNDHLRGPRSAKQNVKSIMYIFFLPTPYTVLVKEREVEEEVDMS